MYKPLPKCLTIKESGIHGLGIFTTEFIDIEVDLGIAHINLPGFPQGFCRTPLGGFYNHSETPNCKLVDSTELFQRVPEIKSSILFLLVKKLVTITGIKKGEELTCSYTLYDLDINNE